jgi:ARG and Rhodanese-Phosphatase-superfamily-associated Protein domain
MDNYPPTNGWTGRLRLACMLVSLLLINLMPGCRSGDHRPPAASDGAPREQTASDTGPAASKVGEVAHYAVSGAKVADGVYIGAPKTYGALTVFPVLAKSQVDVGPLLSLDEALAREQAEVREKGSLPEAQQVVPGDDAPVDAPSQLPQVQRVGNGGASVGTLVIENKGEVPVYVLAGTIVKGGKQDRQIGQDFIIGSKQTVPIDAFCVEHGRWNGVREGSKTGGKFTTIKQLANADVRIAGQYKGDQSEVWSKVSEVNAANKKSSKSDSLLATADDAEVKRERDGLTKRVLADLDAVAPKGAVVGYAYAVGGQVKGARWFAHNRVFSMFREALVNTAVVDALTAQSAGQVSGSPPQAVAVAAFVSDTRRASLVRTRKETAADNTNEYVETPEAYGSTTVLEKGKKKPVKMSEDFASKK